MILNTSISEARGFEYKIIKTIEACLKEEERINMEIKPSLNGIRYDLYLPSGCRDLNWHGKTIIEVKWKLMPDTLYRLASLFKGIPDIKNKIIVYKERRSVFDLQSKDSYGIQCISGDELERMCSSISNVKITPTPDDIMPSQKELEQQAKNDFHNSRISFFLGAGVSMDAKLPSWDKLLKSILKKKNGKPFKHINERNNEGIVSACGGSSIITGRYLYNGYKDDDEFATRIHDALYQEKQSSNLVDSICEAIKTKKISQVITYNYDDLIEQGLEDGDYYSVYTKNRQLDDRMPIFHVHGMLSEKDKTRASFPILSEKDYHDLYKETHNSSNVIQLYALNNTVCYFIGFSMTDPNLRRLLDFSRSNEGKFEVDTSDIPHYVFLKKEKLNATSTQEVDVEHWNTMEDMMREFGLNTIWFEEFQELPKIIRRIIKN